MNNDNGQVHIIDSSGTIDRIGALVRHLSRVDVRIQSGGVAPMPSSIKNILASLAHPLPTERSHQRSSYRMHVLQRRHFCPSMQPRVAGRRTLEGLATGQADNTGKGQSTTVMTSTIDLQHRPDFAIFGGMRFARSLRKSPGILQFPMAVREHGRPSRLAPKTAGWTIR